MNNKLVRLVAVGDVTLGDHPVCFGHGVRSTIEKYGFDYLFKNISQELSGADIVFGNLESVLTADPAASRRMNSLEFRGKVSYAKNMARIGFNVMSVANNHAMQHGVCAFEESVNALRSSNITPVGISVNGLSNYYYKESGDVKIALIAFSMRPDNYTDSGIKYAMGDVDNIVEQIKRLKREGKVVIVSLHWGEEYMNHPSVEQVCHAHNMIDAGANLIIGHHPHVLQGVEHYKHGYIAYSLGNFIADFWQEYARRTLILKCVIDKDGVSQVEFTPVLINTKYQPLIPNHHMRESIMNSLKSYSELIPQYNGTDIEEAMRQYSQAADAAYWAYRKESYVYFLKHLYKYSFSTIAFSGVRYLARRLGIV